MKSGPAEASVAIPAAIPVVIPAYLREVYWWAYLHPNAVRLFERAWLVNLILWGNFDRLRDAALAELGKSINGPVLQIACVYGNFTQCVAARLGKSGQLDVIDVASIQLDNLRSKLKSDPRIRLHRQDAQLLSFPDASFESTLLFFLLHEQPEDVRRATLAEARRVTKPGGKIIIVDYHLPQRSNPLRYLMRVVLKMLEPFALDLWHKDIRTYLPAASAADTFNKTTCFGGLYQKLVITKSAT
jgi:ubiquinone/menaquinone biosynthesis C-methylase UbiE